MKFYFINLSYTNAYTALEHFIKARPENPPELAWSTEDLLQGATPADLFERVVKVAIHDSDRSACEDARNILEQFAGNGECPNHS